MRNLIIIFNAHLFSFNFLLKYNCHFADLIQMLARFTSQIDLVLMYYLLINTLSSKIVKNCYFNFGTNLFGLELYFPCNFHLYSSHYVVNQFLNIHLIYDDLDLFNFIVIIQNSLFLITLLTNSFIECRNLFITQPHLSLLKMISLNWY